MEAIREFYINFFVNQNLPSAYIIDAIALIFIGLYLASLNKDSGRLIRFLGISFCILHLGALVLDYLFEVKIHGIPFMVIMYFLYSTPVVVCLAILLIKKPRVKN